MADISVQLYEEDIEGGFWKEEVRPLLEDLDGLYCIEVYDPDGNNIWDWRSWDGV